MRKNAHAIAPPDPVFCRDLVAAPRCRSRHTSSPAGISSAAVRGRQMSAAKVRCTGRLLNPVGVGADPVDSGEWRGIVGERAAYRKGEVAYAMTLAWTAVSWARGSFTRWGSWGWSWHQRDQAAGASPPPLLGFRPPHGPRPHPGRRRAQERQQQARGGRKVHGEGRGALLAPSRGGGHGRGSGGGLYRKRSSFSDASNLCFRSSTACSSAADLLVSYVASAGRAWALLRGHPLATIFDCWREKK